MRSSSTINRWLLHACLMSMVCVAIGACTTNKPGPVEQRVEPNFDYNPAEATPGKTEITFAVVGSKFEVPFGSTAVSMFQRFASNMAGDFGEIITARGYTLRGPFETYDEMTVVDKENSELILTAEVDFQSDFSGTYIEFVDSFKDRLLKNYSLGILSRGGWKASGQVSVFGRISLIIKESLTNERIWTKSVNISPLTVLLSPSVMYDQEYVTLVDVLNRDHEFYTTLGKRLDAQYDEILSRTYGYLDPSEMLIISKQASELRKRKIY